LTTSVTIGIINQLKVERDSPHGIFLKAQDDSEVLLPKKFVTQDIGIGDVIDVFVYTDSEDRVISTTQTPKAKLNQFALLEVVDTASFGVFVDWGLDKDLLVPLNQQKKQLEKGKSYIFQIVQDTQSNRLIGTTKFQKNLSQETFDLQIQQQVDIFIIQHTPLGYKVIVDDKFDGMIFHNEIFQPLKIGQKLKAYIKTKRKDGKLDLKLQAQGLEKKGSDASHILNLLKTNKKLYITSKSDAEIIYKTVGMSKKSFKTAVQLLLRENLIELEKDAISIK